MAAPARYTPLMNQYAKQRQARLASGWYEEEDDEVDLAPPPPALPSLPQGQHAFAVEPDEAGQRLDLFLGHAATRGGAHLSRARIKTLIGEGAVTIDAAPASEPKTKVRAGQVVVLDMPEAAPAEPQGENIPLTVVYEDDHLIVIDKPAGLVVHPAAGHENGTLVNALIAHCGTSLSGIGGVKRPGIVHRIDKDTSGLLVVAKDDAAHQGLAALFADHGRSGSLVREYRAFVWGEPERSSGSVDAPIGRHTHQREKMTIMRGSKGREAVTHWEKLESFGGQASLIACRLETGRTHQIRVHMAHIGHPLLGDAVYGSGFKTKASRLPEAARAVLAKLHRQALHAAVLGFEHPVTGEELLFESELPPDLAALEEALSGR
ncbi:RluA family pseudouridine synthase [Methylovirgula sp. 4M-Z18]|uniref:RluA family pseudouridine synthase n=1 Tax=Methylovirgula sp. 4M-Z18 TaxID=2293567 RepID=UPI001FDED766|nr:RluA family pseudouridine synthase [Methylovirgula sp. 4M-Z18]